MGDDDTTDDDMLDRVYTTTDPVEMRDFYDEWAGQYDADLADNDYATPGRIAEALVRHLDGTGPVLDFGCGTGLSGVALSEGGFTPIDGYDVSAGMLEVARRTGVYRELIQGDPDAPFSVDLGDYLAVTACGAISPGAAPPQLLDEVIDALAPGGLLVVSLNEHALETDDYTGRIDAAVADGRVERVEALDGPHIPGLDLMSRVVVVRRR